MEKTLNFSEPFLNVDYISNEEDYEIQHKSIIINLDLDPLEISDQELPTLHSMMFANTSVARVRNMLHITIAKDRFIGKNPDVDEEIIKNTWNHVSQLFNAPQLKRTTLWRSQKERVRNFELNLWYAPAGTHCGIHKQHEFLEVHTQVYGVGRMQKFHRNDLRSLYQDVIMSPGYTHEPFYSSAGKYPWHQYYAESDCIWLALEKY
jgi:hypothetical protein